MTSTLAHAAGNYIVCFYLCIFHVAHGTEGAGQQGQWNPIYRTYRVLVKGKFTLGWGGGMLYKPSANLVASFLLPICAAS